MLAKHIYLTHFIWYKYTHAYVHTCVYVCRYIKQINMHMLKYWLAIRWNFMEAVNKIVQTPYLWFHILHACLPGQLQLKQIYSLNISILCISSNHRFWWPHYVQASCQIVHMNYLCFHFVSMSPKENATTSSTSSEKILYALMDAYILSQSSHLSIMRWSIKRK